MRSGSWHQSNHGVQRPLLLLQPWAARPAVPRRAATRPAGAPICKASSASEQCIVRQAPLPQARRRRCHSAACLLLRAVRVPADRRHGPQGPLFARGPRWLAGTWDACCGSTKTMAGPAPGQQGRGPRHHQGCSAAAALRRHTVRGTSKSDKSPQRRPSDKSPQSFAQGVQDKARQGPLQPAGWPLTKGALARRARLSAGPRECEQARRCAVQPRQASKASSGAAAATWCWWWPSHTSAHTGHGWFALKKYVARGNAAAAEVVWSSFIVAFLGRVCGECGARYGWFAASFRAYICDA